jgi:hypothetical protein
MKCLSLKHSRGETKILALDDTRAHSDPMMRSPWLPVTGQDPKSLPSPRAHHWATHLPQQSQYSGISAHI